MKKTDMELQAIREKLRSLQAEPPAAETLSMPWSPPRASESAQSHRPKISGDRQAQAIEALQQRSRGHESAVHSRVEGLVAQEIYRLEVQANSINARSQQQAADIMAMKRSAQQATVALARQGIHDHPQLGAIAQFFASYQSAVVPHIDRDARGNFTLTYTTIDFEQAEQEAIDTAQSLRQRAGSALFSQPIETGTVSTEQTRESPSKPEQAMEIYGAVFESEWLRAAMEGAVSQFNRILKQSRRYRRKKIAAYPKSKEYAISGVHHDLEEQPLGDDYSSEQFSWEEGATWFVGAAIARLAIELTTISYATIRTSVSLALVGVISFALYQVMFSKSSDYSLVYRLFIAMAGLFLASFVRSLF